VAVKFVAELVLSSRSSAACIISVNKVDVGLVKSTGNLDVSKSITALASSLMAFILALELAEEPITVRPRVFPTG